MKGKYVVEKLNDKKWFIWFKIVIVWLSYMPLGLFITSRDFSLDFYYSVLPLSDEFRQYWFTENFYNQLVYGVITVGIFITLIFRYKYKKTDNFQFTRSTAVIMAACVIVSIVAIVFSYSNNNHPWQAYIGETIKLFVGVSIFEELIFRGFITNELFRLKKDGLKIPVGILISAILFGLMHLPAYFFYSEITFGGAIFRFVFPAIIGTAYAIILYYKKDILSLIFIHTASNICGSIARQPFDIIFFVVMCTYATLLIPQVRQRLSFLKK
jgi:membrane protease YdiL (CAAX protease family)